MPPSETGPSGVFSLDAAAKALEGFQAPAGPFDPNAAWENVYSVLTLASLSQAVRAHPVGKLTVRKTLASDDRIRLSIRDDRPLPGHWRRTTHGELVCSNDLLATPAEWTLRFETRDQAGDLLRELGGEKSGVLEPGSIVLGAGDSHRRIAVRGAVTSSYSLFDAVQRAARGDLLPQQFTLLDHLDQVKPDHRLAFRSTEVLRLGTRSVIRQVRRPLERGVVLEPVRQLTGGTATTLHAYEQTGDGIIPIVYWVDDLGRLLFVVSGLEAYVISRSTSVQPG